MKRLFFAISVVALALVSCTQFEPETPVTYEKTVAPTLTVTVTGDNSIAVEVLPGSNTGYYAYAIVAGEVDPATVDAATLIAGKLAGSIAKEVANAAKKDTLKVEAKKLTPNAKYTAVAVAAGKETQAFSEVVAQTVTTTDKTVPNVVASKYDFEVDGDAMVFYVPFDDPITLTADATFVARVFAINVASASGVLSAIGQANVPVDSVKVDKDGKTLVVNVPKTIYAPGAFIGLMIGPGSVKNPLDSLNKAYTTLSINRNSGSISGLVGQYEYANFDLESPIAEDSLVKFQDPAALAIVLDAKLEGSVNQLYDVAGNVTVTDVNPISGRKVEYTLDNWGISAAKSVTLGLDESAFGYYSTFSVEEGAVEDIYGNVNNELVIEDQVLCSYGYTLDAILGTYTFTGTSEYGVNQNDTKVVIAPSDKSAHDVVVYDMFLTTGCLDDLAGYGLTYVPSAFVKFYADFDVDSGMLTVYGDMIGRVTQLAEYVYAVGEGDDDEFQIAFSSPGNGVLVSDVYIYFKSGGTWDTVLPGATLTRTSTSYAYTEPASAPAPSKKAVKKGAVSKFRTIENLKAAR